MDSCLRDYHLMLKAADAEMENAINQMPLNKWEYVFHNYIILHYNKETFIRLLLLCLKRLDP